MNIQDELATETENTGINTPGMMGKMGDTWRGVETRTMTGINTQGIMGKNIYRCRGIET